MKLPKPILLLLSLLAVMLPPQAYTLDKDALRLALSGTDRDVVDFARDSSRKPVEVLDFLGIEPGMQVLDLYAAGGYYSFILGKAVGPKGTVYAQNTPRGLRFEEDRQDITQGEVLSQKLARGKLDNVVPVVASLQDIPLAPNSLDAALVMQVLHDYYNRDASSALNMLLQIKALLKPGGVVGISDHIGLAGNNNRDLHRIQLQQAITLAEQAGFEVLSSDLLRNRQDIHNRAIFDPRLARNTDRLLLKLIKPVD